MADTDILVSEMTPASQINTTDLMIMTQPDAQAETGYSTKSGTVLQVANKMLKGTEYSTDLPDFTDKTPLGGLEELKADIKALLPIGSASGNPCNFETDIADTLVSLKAAILASGGNGTPSTPIPIVEHSELNLVRCGKNFVALNTSPYQAAVNTGVSVNSESTDSLSITSSAVAYACRQLYYKLPAGTYTISMGGTTKTGTANPVISIYDYPNGTLIVNSLSANNNVVFTLSAETVLDIRLFATGNTAEVNTVTFNNVQIEVGSTATAYAPYNGTPYLVQFGQTVYGGVYDANRGKVHVTHKIVDMGDLNWSYSTTGYFYATPFPNSVKPNINNNTTPNMLCSVATPDTPNHVYAGSSDNIITCTTATPSSIWIRDNSYTDASTYKTAMMGQKIVYELATPIEIDVSELSVETIVGVNNIISDGGGDVEVQYRDSIQHYIDSKIASVQALIL